MYRPVKRSGSDIDFKYSEDVKIKAQRVTTYGDEVYVSDNTKIKPMTLHRIKTHNDEILKEYGIDKKPKIVIFDINEYGGAYGKYNAVDNTVYYCSDILSKELKKDVDTVRHELWHMNQAEEYRAKFGEITDENHLDYIAYTCGVAKKYIDKMGINEYNVGEISDYAKKMYKYSRYDEVEAEYIASTSRKGRK